MTLSLKHEPRTCHQSYRRRWMSIHSRVLRLSKTVSSHRAKKVRSHYLCMNSADLFKATCGRGTGLKTRSTVASWIFLPARLPVEHEHGHSQRGSYAFEDIRYTRIRITQDTTSVEKRMLFARALIASSEASRTSRRSCTSACYHAKLDTMQQHRPG
jgi:hypothetical protein